jgi:ubiquinone/menaquinone biosynthesis C-methylase UbiE
MEQSGYVHGYSGREAIRLKDQADTLEEIIHNDTIFQHGSRVLEAGCGVGAQTRIIAPKNPQTEFISVDISEASLAEAQQLIHSSGIDNVEFRQADIYDLPFKDGFFDSVIICFVLEHLDEPQRALTEMIRVVRNGGTIIAIEGDHGSTFFHPDSQSAQSAIDCLIRLQSQDGGNANIGRALYPLLRSAGLSDVLVTPRMVYADASRPELVEGFIKNTFTAMVEGIGERVVKEGLTDRRTFEQGVRDLYRTTEPDGVFIYTFFKGKGIKKMKSDRS